MGTHLDERRITLSRHAAEAIVNLDIEFEDVEKVVREGERVPEGRNKARYRLRTKKGLLIAICREFPEEVAVITVTATRRRR